MSIAQLSPKSVTVNPAYTNPQVRTNKASTTAQVNHTAENTLKKARTDTVTISRQAAQMAVKAQGSAEKAQSLAAKSQRSFAVKA
jgi:hypothetical protein